MCDNKNKATFLVEIVVPANSTQQRIQFTDQPYLRNKPMAEIETFTANDLALSPQGNILPSPEQLSNAYITFYITDVDNPQSTGEWIQLLPMWRLHNLQNLEGDPFERERFLLAGQVIIWEKCYITLAAQLGSDVPVSFLLNVGFSNPSS